MRRAGLLVALVLLAGLAVIGGLLLGGGAAFDAGTGGIDLSVPTMASALLWRLTGVGAEPGASQLLVLFDVRLPEVLLAAVVGCGLAVSGGIFQVTLRNPLADPLLLGVAAGASLAASIAIGLGATGGLVPAIAATAGAGATLAFVFAVAGRRGRFDPATMVLAGGVASTFYSAITLFLLAVTPSRTISQILQWTMGGFADVGFAKVRWAAPALIALASMGVAGARPLNLLALGDESARSSGLAVAAAGVVGFVGLVVPHLARFLVGPDQRVALPASALAVVLAGRFAHVG